MPKYFDPNGKVNQFMPSRTFLPAKYEMIILDRWGTEVFETTNTEQGWNGRYSGGGSAPQGVYLYYVKMTGSDGRSTELKGTFTLVIP